MLDEAIQKLPDESKTIISLYYYNDMSQKEIAEMLNLTQMQISRKIKKAFSLLYHMIADSNQNLKGDA